LIRSITAWIGNGGNSWSATRLWITPTDSAGRPMDWVWLFRSPVYNVPPISYPEHRWNKAKFTFDPPLSLPGPGLYAFFLQDPCGTSIWMPFVTGNPYPGGAMWATGRAGPVGCDLSGPAFQQGLLGRDLAFEVEFCRETITSVRRKSWGQVKSIYR
jgi:hypothetical protein